MISIAMVRSGFFNAKLFFYSRMDHVFSLPLAVAALLVPAPVRWVLLAAANYLYGPEPALIGDWPV